VDDFDSAILNILQTNSRISTEEIGDVVGLSPSACQRRIKKLKTDGIIKKEVAIIDRNKLDNYTTAIIDVTLEKGGENALDIFIDKLEREKQVQQFYYTVGDVDFVLIIVVKSMVEFDTLTRRLLMSDPNVKKFHSKIAIQANKLSLEVPM
jgi:Lrp/AsnC family transcriptional regulator, leucine-responsive regulatory protein